MHDATAQDDRDLVADHLGVGKDVRRDEDRLSLVAQRQDQVPHVSATERIEARHRLVEDQEIGISDQRLCQADALAHAL